ncbi:MAG: LacI family DNA-binding transcriptional regulator [Opitutaceae bacterium]
MVKKQGDPISSRRVTLRDIAAELSISHVSVSKALRNLPGVSEQLKVKVRAKADEMGYVPDPLLASLSRYRSKDPEKQHTAQIAWINPWASTDDSPPRSEFEKYWQGAMDSAQRLGFHLEEFNSHTIPLGRIESILRARSIQGILIPPLQGAPFGWETIDWNQFAVVRFGQSLSGPSFDCVSSSQVRNTMLAFSRVRELGYQRIGFVCEYWSRRLFGAGYFWAQQELPNESQLPLLALDPSHDFEQQQAVFNEWMGENQPDAIITDNSETHAMLVNLGYRIPVDIGLATTSIHDTRIDSGIDQNPYQIGRAGVRLLTALIAERRFGIPDSRNEILIEGQWVDGSMLPSRS